MYITINELSKQTGLTIPSIRKILSRLNPILESHIKRGDNNKLLFDDNAIVIFDKISQYRKEGIGIPEIDKKLRESLKEGKGWLNQGVEVGQSEEKTNPNLVSELVSKLDKSQSQLLAEKEKRLQERDEKLELEKAYHSLKETMKLLPEGKTPEQIKEDWEKANRKKQEIDNILSQLENLGLVNLNPLTLLKKRKLMQRLRELNK